MSASQIGFTSVPSKHKDLVTMASEVILETTKQVRKVFDEDFLACCLTNERAKEWQATRTQLEGVDSSHSYILGGLVDRVLRGSSQDVEMYVSLVFDLPFGLKANLVRMIMERCTNVKVSVAIAQEENHTSCQSSLVSVLLREWKSGSLTPEQLFSRINSLVAGGEIGLREAQRVTNLVLQEAGYDCMQWNPLEGRSQIKSSVCSLLEVDRMFCDAHSAHVFSAAGSFVQLQPAQLHRSDIFYTTGRCMSSTAQLWWEHVGDSDCLEFCSEGSSPPGPGPKGGCFSQPASRPTLLIGDYVHMQEMCIEVSQVIAVDALSAEPAASIFHFCILLQGAVLPGRSGFGASCVETDPYRDGETEQNSPHHRAHGSNSSANSEDEENQHSQPPQETHKRYVLLFVAVLDEIPAVMCACALHELVLHDQIPTNVRYLASGLALVSGSNGLLGLVKSGAGVAEPLHKHTNSAKSPHKTEPKVHLSGPRSTYTTFTLVDDSLLTEVPPGFVRSHSGDAAITTVDAVHAECASVDQITLVSGDAQGVVCLWHVDPIVGCGYLVCPRYQVDSDPRRVVSLHLSPSGAHVAVGLLDRLVLLNTTTSTSSSSSAYAQARGLHVRACLDVLCGTQALYGVSFHTDCLRVWRVVNEVRSPSAPGVSYKSELDSFADHEVEVNTHVAAEPDRVLQSGLTSRAQSRAQSVGEDLSALSVDPELPGEGVFPSYAMEGEDASPQDEFSPRVRGWRSVQSPLSGKVGAGMVPAAHLPGISVTTWLHLNVDSFDTRHGSTLSELEAQLSPSRVKVHRHKAHVEHAGHSQLGIASTWQEVPTVDSCVSLSGAASPTEPPVLQRDDSANSASSGNVSSYTADGTALRDVYSRGSGGSEGMAEEVPGLQLGTHSSLSVTDSTATEDEAKEEAGSEESVQYVQLGDEFMPLYAPLMSSVVPALPPAPPSLATDESNALGAIPPALTADRMHVSQAVSGYQVYISEGVTNFRRVIQIHGLGAPSFVPPEANTYLADGSTDERGIDTSVVMDHRARHSSHFSLYGMHRPFHSFKRRVLPDLDSIKRMITWFKHDSSEKFLRVKLILAVICACYQPPTIGIIAAALERPLVEVTTVLHADLQELLSIGAEDKKSLVTVRPEVKGLFKWLCSENCSRIGALFWIDPALGHNILCSLYLRYCGNKSVAVEHAWQDYLRTYGPTHLRHASRGLRLLTANIRKIDETANIRVHLPRQIGYIVGLYEIYARRVGLRGRIPAELGQLKNLRVLSMGNNHLCGELPASLGELRNLQRIVLHQNNLRGPVPPALGELGCIVNLAGNPLLHHGDDVPAHERQALVELYNSTRGITWSTKNYWCTAQPVAKWYKVGVLTSHVHSIVMSSNGMEGRIPSSIAQLTYLRMIELATMPGLIGTLPRELCSLTTLRRLCICRCGLTGRIPSEIGRLVGLEELQLFGNQLSGSVPASISCLTNLKLLSLGEYTGGNNFTSEPLPQCLASLVHLEALFMANCNIKGQLPDWLGNLTELRQLDLQRNQLCGTVPGSIGRLQNLLYLNIKDNQNLSGRLPLTQLLSLSKLNRLSLVHCNFVDTDYAIEALKAHLPRCKVWI